METQNKRLLDYLNEHETIQPLEAWTKLGIYRLGARVWDLKTKYGAMILTEKCKVFNQFGEPCRVAKYRLVK